MKDELYLQALQNYLNGSEWRDSTQIFISANCLYFENIHDYHMQQHVIWKNFQEIAESILQMALTTVGGTIEELEDALESVQSRPSRGPRDEVVKDVIRSLQSVDDFDHFAKVMREHCVDALRERDVSGEGNRWDMLMRTGFTVQHINDAHERLGDDAPLEEIVGFISARVAEEETTERTRSKPGNKKTSNKPSLADPAPPKRDTLSPRRSAGNTYSYFETTRNDGNENKSPRSSSKHRQQKKSKSKRSKALGALVKFVEEAATEDVHVDIDELQVKFSTADSILESYQELLSEPQRGADDDHMLELTKWAAEMKLFQNDLLEAFESEIHSRDMCFNHTHGLLVWFDEMETQRKEINERAIAGDMLSDAEMKRMAELDRIVAEQGTDQEKRLHFLLSRHEVVRVEIQNFYRKISIVISTNNSELKRDLVEETYLFLKEHVVGGQQSLEELFFSHCEGERESDAKSSFSSTAPLQKIVSLRGGVELVNLFLELHSLEDEQQFLKTEINALLGVVSPAHADTTQRGAENPFVAQATVDGATAALDEIFAMDPTQPLEDKASDDAKPSSDAVADGKTTSDDESKYGMDAKISDAAVEQAALAAAAAAAAAAADAKTEDAKESAISRPDAKKSSSSSAGDEFVDALKQSHRDALERLKTVLEAERLQKLHDLESRLLMRKRKLQQRETLGGSNDDAALSLDEEIAVVQLLEEELRGVDEQHQFKKQCVFEGLKTHCIHELKAARSLCAESEESALRSPVMRERLLHERQSEINGDAAKTLREKYERERDKLLALHASEKERQRAKLLKALERRAKGAAGAAEQGNTAEDAAKVQEQLQAMEDKLDRDLQRSLIPLREQLLLGLGGVSLAQELALDTKEQQKKKKNALEDEDDLYGDVDDHRKTHKHTLNYVDQLDAMKRMYVEAGDKLQRDLLAKKGRLRDRRRKPTEREDKDEKASENEKGKDSNENAREQREYEELVQVVDNMVLTAFDTHVLDLSAGLRENHEQSSPLGKTLSSSAASVNTKEMEQRVKAGLLEAFEKAKTDLQDAQTHKKKVTQDRLAQRRKQRETAQADSKEDDDEGEGEESKLDETDATRVEGLLEEVMDAFLEPTTARNAAESATQAARATQSRSHRETSPRFEDEKTKIVNEHAVKEKALVDDLYASMMEKKKKLEERMKRKREKQQQLQQQNGQGTVVEEQKLDDEEQQEQAKIQAWEDAFKKVAASLQHVNPSSLSNMTAEQLVLMMERLATNAAEPSSATLQTPSRSTQNSRPVSAHQQAAAEKEYIQRQAARISTAYQEEQHKHDLMMKIQQTRQRQALQRKLWERNQARAQQLQEQKRPKPLPLPHLSSVSSEKDEVDEEEDEDEEEEESTKGSISIGQYKSRLSEMQPAFRQPAIRGLGNVPSLSDLRAPATQQKSMQLRGLNLAPMQMRR